MYRIDPLLKADQKLFHTGDLALLWGNPNKNTLYTLVKRYLDRGILIPIHKGFYSTIPINKIDPFRLAVGYLHRYAYLSCETVLTSEGIIFQQGEYLTLVSSKSATFILGENKFLVRSLNGKYLFNNLGVVNRNDIFEASLERAVADILYFNKNYYFDNKMKIDWKTVRKIQKEVYQI